MVVAARLRLGVNIDHVATMRNARGGAHPDPVRAAKLAAEAGADGITAHLREDRRHIGDGDIARLATEIDLPLNLEMAATAEMVAIESDLLGREEGLKNAGQRGLVHALAGVGHVQPHIMSRVAETRRLAFGADFHGGGLDA